MVGVYLQRISEISRFRQNFSFLFHTISVFSSIYLQSTMTQAILLLFILTITTVWSKPFQIKPVQSVVYIIPANEHIPFAAQINAADLNTMHQRSKRSSRDPYDQYYFYPSYLNTPSSVNAPDRDYYDGGSYINRREAIDPNQIDGPNGKKYKYTPLFQYKATQSRRRKLFVPNLFG